MTEQVPDYVERYNEKLQRQEQRGLLLKCLFWGVVIWAATHWPGALLVWLFTFQWI